MFYATLTASVAARQREAGAGNPIELPSPMTAIIPKPRLLKDSHVVAAPGVAGGHLDDQPISITGCHDIQSGELLPAFVGVPNVWRPADLNKGAIYSCNQLRNALLL